MQHPCTRTPRIALFNILLGLVGLAAISAQGAAGVRADSPPPSTPSPEPCRMWRSRLDAADTPDARRIASIALAECLLERRCAPSLTAELTERPYDRAALLQTLREVVTLLESPADDGAPSEEKTDPGRDRVQMLRAFAETFRAIADNDDSEASRKALTSACVELAIYTDDEDEGIAAAATLWQAAAYRRAGRADRTLQMMWPALGRSDGSIIDYFGRLERCRALADAERYVAAITLSIKIEGKVDEWMIDTPREVRLAARQTARETRAAIYRRWSAALAKQGHAKQAAAARGKADELGNPADNTMPNSLQLDTTIAPLPSIAAIDAAPGA